MFVDFSSFSYSEELWAEHEHDAEHIYLYLFCFLFK